MFYKTLIRDKIRLPPTELDKPAEEALLKELQEKYTGYISKEMGVVVDVIAIKSTGDGHVIPEDGAVYFETESELLTFKPESSELVFGKIRDIAEFGAFMSIGPIDAMVHISQTMDDFVSFAKDKTLSGRESKKVLKVNDLCIGRIIAVSYKEIANPKIGVTMRQKGLGKIEWLKEPDNDSKKKSGV